MTFSASNGSSTITVSDTATAIVNDFVTFSGAASLGGNITAAVLNQEYQIASIVNDDSYTITAKDTGAAVTIVVIRVTEEALCWRYQINGSRHHRSRHGLGCGSLGPWNVGLVFFFDCRRFSLLLWSHDNFDKI